MVVEIPLTKGYVASVDDADAEYLGQYKWYARVSPGVLCAARYVKSEGGEEGQHVLMHRLLLDAPKDLEVDHINRNSLDNRRCNLRLATRSQNEANKPPKRDRRFKGVYWRKDNHLWRALIRVHGRLYSLGQFTTEIDAARAYDAAAVEAFGEFAFLNFPCEHAVCDR